MPIPKAELARTIDDWKAARQQKLASKAEEVAEAEETEEETEEEAGGPPRPKFRVKPSAGNCQACGNRLGGPVGTRCYTCKPSRPRRDGAATGRPSVPGRPRTVVIPDPPGRSPIVAELGAFADDLAGCIAELEAVVGIARALMPLTPASRGRVIRWASDLLDHRPDRASNQEQHHDP